MGGRQAGEFPGTHWTPKKGEEPEDKGQLALLRSPHQSLAGTTSNTTKHNACGGEGREQRGMALFNELGGASLPPS